MLTLQYSCHMKGAYEAAMEFEAYTLCKKCILLLNLSNFPVNFATNPRNVVVPQYGDTLLNPEVLLSTAE